MLYFEYDTREHQCVVTWYELSANSIVYTMILTRERTYVKYVCEILLCTLCQHYILYLEYDTREQQYVLPCYVLSPNSIFVYYDLDTREHR